MRAIRLKYAAWPVYKSYNTLTIKPLIPQNPLSKRLLLAVATTPVDSKCLKTKASDPLQTSPDHS